MQIKELILNSDLPLRPELSSCCDKKKKCCKKYKKKGKACGSCPKF